MSKMKLRIVLIAAAVTCAAALTMGVTLALFSDRATGELSGSAGRVEVTLHEETPFPSTDPYGVAVDQKIFWGENTGNKREYVRAKIITGVEWFDASTNTWKTAPVSEQDVQYTVTAVGWVEQDGYWYYSKILKPGDLTTRVYVQDVQLVGELPEEIAEKPLRFLMDVQLEGAQATHDAYKEIFHITSLPAGVERI